MTYVYSGIMEMMAIYGKLSLPLGEFMFVVLFVFIPYSKLTNHFNSTSTLNAMTAGDNSQQSLA